MITFVQPLLNVCKLKHMVKHMYIFTFMVLECTCASKYWLKWFIGETLRPCEYLVLYFVLMYSISHWQPCECYTHPLWNSAPAGVLLGILVGLCHSVPQILTLRKNVIFHICFETGPLKSIPVFGQALVVQKLDSAIHRIKSRETIALSAG